MTVSVTHIFMYEYKQLMLCLLPHGVTLSFTYTDDDDDLQTGIYIYRERERHTNV